MTLFRRALVAVLAVITMVPFLANGTASAAPATKATQAEVSTTKGSVLVKVSNGGVAVEDGKLVLEASRSTRSGWDEAFACMAAAGDDAPLLGEDGNAFDDAEWTW